MNDWQPIETVPKDGTFIDVWAIPLNGAPEGRYTDIRWIAGSFRHMAFSSDPGVFGQPVCAEITHWQPLPEPPHE